MQGFDLNAFVALAQQVPGQAQQPQAPTYTQTQFPQPAQPAIYAPQIQAQQFPPQQQQQQNQWQGGATGGFQAHQFPAPLHQMTPVPVPPMQQFGSQVVQQGFGQQQAPPPQFQLQMPAPNAIFFSDEWNPQNGWMADWFPARFQGTKGNCKYMSVEQYLTEKMAILANDAEVRKAIMAVQVEVVTPQGIDWQTNRQANQYLRQLGQQIRNFNHEEWDKLKIQVMRTALTYKFAQNQPLYDLLLKTGDDVLFNASADDYWGIGIGEQEARSGAVQMVNWGSNFTGFLLMEIRSAFRKTGKPAWSLPQANKPEVSMTRSEVSAEAPTGLTTPLPVDKGKEELVQPAPVVETKSVPPTNPLFDVLKQEVEVIKPPANPTLDLPVQQEQKPAPVQAEATKPAEIATTVANPPTSEPVIPTGTVDPLTLLM